MTTTTLEMIFILSRFRLYSRDNCHQSILTKEGESPFCRVYNIENGYLFLMFYIARFNCSYRLDSMHIRHKGFRVYRLTHMQPSRYGEEDHPKIGEEVARYFSFHHTYYSSSGLIPRCTQTGGVYDTRIRIDFYIHNLYDCSLDLAHIYS